MPSDNRSEATGIEVVGSGAKVGYLTVVSRWKEVMSKGDAFVKSTLSAYSALSDLTYDSYRAQDLLAP
jgi:hypothetical protein